MPRIEDITNAIWDDLDDLSNDALMLYVWSFTNPRCGMAGIYKCPRRRLLEGRLEDEQLAAAIDDLSVAGLIRYEDDVLWCVARVKRLKPKSSQMAKSVIRDLAEIPAAHPLRAAFLGMYEGMPWGSDALTFPGGSPDLHPTFTRRSESPPTEPNGRTSPEPHPNIQGKGNGKGNGAVDRTTTPSGSREQAPKQVQQAYPEVVAALGRICEQRALPFEPNTRESRVIDALRTYPDADHVAVVRDMEDWLVNGTGKSREIRDLVATLRSQLDRKQHTTRKSAIADDGTGVLPGEEAA